MRAVAAAVPGFVCHSGVFTSTDNGALDLLGRICLPLLGLQAKVTSGETGQANLECFEGSRTYPSRPLHHGLAVTTSISGRR